MSDTSENAGNGGAESLRKLEGLREGWRKRARNNLIVVWCYSAVVIALFVGASLIVWFADVITQRTFDLAYSIAVEAPERFTLRRSFDFRGVALGRGDDTVFAVGEKGFILAADSGSGLRDWKSLPSNTGKSFRGIAVSDDGDIAIAVGRSGLVRRSDDRGETWTDPGGVAAQNVNGVALSGDGGIAILVGNSGLVRRSDDRGETWKPPDRIETEGNWDKLRDVNGVALSGDGEIAILVGDRGRIRHSVDGGRTWRGPGLVTTEQGRREDVNAVAMSSDGGTAILVGDNGLAKSSADGGRTWKSCITKDGDDLNTKVGDDLNGVALSRDGKTAVAAGDDGLVLVFDIDVQKEVCRGDGRNVGTSHGLHAVVLDEDSDGKVIATVVGRSRTIMRSDVSSSSFEGAPVGGLQVSKHPEEREEPRDSELSDLSQELYLYSTSLRVGIIAIFMFWVGHLAGLTRYHLRLATHYDARGDAIVLVGAGLSSEPPAGLSYLERAISALSSDGIGFSDAKSQRNKLVQLVQRNKQAPPRAAGGTAQPSQGDE